MALPACCTASSLRCATQPLAGRVLRWFEVGALRELRAAFPHANGGAKVVTALRSSAGPVPGPTAARAPPPLPGKQLRRGLSKVYEPALRRRVERVHQAAQLSGVDAAVAAVGQLRGMKRGRVCV